MAAYIRLTSRNFKTKGNFDFFRLPCAAAPVQSTASTHLSLRFLPCLCAVVYMPRTEPVAIPGLCSKQKKVSGGCLPTSSVGPKAQRFLTLYLAKRCFIPEFRVKPFLPVKFSKMGSYVIALLLNKPSWNSWGALIFFDTVTIMNIASSVIWMAGCRCAQETFPVRSAKSGYQGIWRLMTGPSSSNRNASWQRPRRGLLTLWTIP